MGRRTFMVRHLGVLLFVCLVSPLTGQTTPQFTNVDVSTGLTLPPSFGINRGAAWADFDGDGDVDLFAPEGSVNPIRLWVNQGNGTFVPQIVDPGGGAARHDQGCVAADIDNDGDQDVFICQGTNHSCRLYINDGAGNFTEEAALRGVDWSGHALAATFGDYDRDGFLDLFVSEWDFTLSTHRLFRNNGDGTFTDVSVAAGVDIPGASYAAVFCDIDEDGWPDIFCSRDDTGPNVIFRNNMDGTFTDVAPSLNADDQFAAMCITMGDIHNDGDWDFFLTNIQDHELLEWNDSTQSFNVHNNVLHGVAQSYGLTGGWAWGGMLFDYDNDGNLDLYYNCIYQFNRLFRGHGDTSPFTEVSGQVGIDSALPPSYGVALVDYDDDGNLDIFNSSGQAGGHLARNPGFGGHWLGLSLEGTISNRDAVGSVVIAKSASGVRRRMVMAGDGFLCTNDRRIHFGVGSDTMVDEVEIRWPSGSVSYLENVAVDQYLNVVEPDFALNGNLAPGSFNSLDFSPMGDAGLFYGVFFTGTTWPPVVLPDGRRIRTWTNDILLNITVQPNNAWFGPSSGIVPSAGPASVFFHLPNLPQISGLGANAIAFTVDPSYPASIKSILGPKYIEIP